MKRTIAGFVEAVGWIAMAGENDDLVATILEANGGIDYETLSTADAQIGMEKDYGLGLVGRGLLLLLLACHGKLVGWCVWG